VKNPVLPHGVFSKEKALLAIHPRSSEQGILAFLRKELSLFFRTRTIRESPLGVKDEAPDRMKPLLSLVQLLPEFGDFTKK
jgi:hypothetical protein